MKTKYTNPEIEILLFDEGEILTVSGEDPKDIRAVTAAEDVLAQMNQALSKSGKSSSVTTVRLEDIQLQN